MGLQSVLGITSMGPQDRLSTLTRNRKLSALQKPVLPVLRIHILGKVRRNGQARAACKGHRRSVASSTNHNAEALPMTPGRKLYSIRRCPSS